MIFSRRIYFFIGLLASVFILSHTTDIRANGGKQILGVVVPDSILFKQTGESLKLNGYGVHTQWGEKLFVGAIYSTQLHTNPTLFLVNDEPTAMVYYFIQDDISAEMFLRSLLESLLINNDGWNTQNLNEKKMLDLPQALVMPINAGDVLVWQYSPQKGLFLLLNGRVLQYWPNAKSFFNLILRTWLGPYPVSRDFKRGVLGLEINKARTS